MRQAKPRGKSTSWPIAADSFSWWSHSEAEKLWRWKYRVDGIEKQMAFRVYPNGGWALLGSSTPTPRKFCVRRRSDGGNRQTDPAKFTMPIFAPRLIYSMATVRWWWLPRWVPSRPLAEVRAATSDLLTMLSIGALTLPAIVRYSIRDFQDAVRLADGEAGQEKVLLDFSERAP